MKRIIIAVLVGLALLLSGMWVTQKRGGRNVIAEEGCTSTDEGRKEITSLGKLFEQSQDSNDQATAALLFATAGSYAMCSSREHLGYIAPYLNKQMERIQQRKQTY